MARRRARAAPAVCPRLPVSLLSALSVNGASGSVAQAAGGQGARQHRRGPLDALGCRRHALHAGRSNAAVNGQRCLLRLCRLLQAAFVLMAGGASERPIGTLSCRAELAPCTFPPRGASAAKPARRLAPRCHQLVRRVPACACYVRACSSRTCPASRVCNSFCWQLATVLARARWVCAPLSPHLCHSSQSCILFCGVFTEPEPPWCVPRRPRSACTTSRCVEGASCMRGRAPTRL